MQKIYERFSQLQQLETEAAIALQWHPERVNHHMAETYLMGCSPGSKSRGFLVVRSRCLTLSYLVLHIILTALLHL
ncbi:MAG TPA: hypothetical protein V6D09_17090 [Leptolyngbyaceae cyanobacterium]